MRRWMTLGLCWVDGSIQGHTAAMKEDYKDINVIGRWLNGKAA